MKRFNPFLFALVSLSLGLYGQGHIEDFEDGDLSGWGGQADYKLSNTGSELQVIARKTSDWNSFEYNFTPTDITANPYVSIRVKSNVDFNLDFSVWDHGGVDYSYSVNDSYQTIVHSDGYANYTFDFRDVTGVDLTLISKLNFVFNPGGANGCNATVFFDDIRIGDQAMVAPAMAKIEDQFHGLNAPEVNIRLWGIKDRATGGVPLTISAVSSNPGLIPDPVISYTSGDDFGWLSYTPVTDQSGTSVISVSLSGNARDENKVEFTVTVEPNSAPRIENIETRNIRNDRSTGILISGLDDGDPNDNQMLTLTTVSSDHSILPDPLIEYKPGDFDATLLVTPVEAQTGSVTITITVMDDGGTIAGGVDTATMEFEVRVYPDVNNPPFMNQLIDVSILQDEPEQYIPLRGISDGDEDKDQNLFITAVSSNQEIIPDPQVTYIQGSPGGSLSFTSVPGQTGTSVITVTITDDGGTAENNGDETVTYTFEAEVRVKPIVGWEDEFNDGVLGPEWPAAWGDPGEDTHLCTEQDGAMRIQVDKTRTNNMWAGLWFAPPTELDLSGNPYISITMKTDEAPKDMLIFLWDAYDHYNTAKTVRHTVSGAFTEYYFDYSDPSFQLQGDGTVVDISRIKALLINFDPGGNTPLYVGSFYFDDFRVGDKAHKAYVAPKVRMNDIPDYAIVKDAGGQSITISGISDGAGDLNEVNILATSSNSGLIPDPVVDPVTGGMAKLKFTPVTGATGKATVTVEASANGSASITKTFDISVSSLEASTATDVRVDLSTTYQEIDGFGAFMGSGETSPDTIITLAEDIGMSMARFGLIGNGFEEVNDNSDPNILNLDAFNPDALSISNMQRIAPFVDKFILTVWSPAGWMKFNKWEDGVSSWATDNKLDPQYYAEYAEEIVALIKIVKRETGKDIYGIGLQNEPQFNEPYPSCQVNPEEFRDIIKIVGPRLEAEGYGDVKLFWAEALPAQNSIDQYINAVKTDPEAAKYADIVAIHNYDSDGISVGGAGCNYWSTIFNWAQAGTNPYKTWMTETSGHPDTWNGAMTLAGNIFNALHCGQASAWVFWSFSVSEGSPEYGLVVSNRPSSRYFVSKQYYKFIRPGAVRVEATSEGIPVLAFSDAQNKTVSVILYNNTSEAQSLEIKGAGLPSQWDVYTTSESRNCELQEKVGPNGLILIPPSSLVTLVGDHSNPAPTLDDIPDQYVDENSGTHMVSLSGISDGVGFDQELAFTAVSSNPALIADPVVSYSQGEAEASLSFTPEADQSGEVVITINLSDNGEPLGVKVTSFRIFVSGETSAPAPGFFKDALKVYPNPASGVLFIEFTPGESAVLNIMDVSGRVVYHSAIGPNERKLEVDISEFAPGVYMIQLIHNRTTEKARFMVE
jgi:O-glycosyl hydrolase